MNEVTYESIVHFMNHMEFSGMKLGIERIRQALEMFGNPESEFKVIHVVGTNGKGSVATMLSKILQKSCLRVGTFTSPHLVDVRERIRVDGEMISQDEFREVFLEAKSKLADLTFFELLTLMAVLYFKKKGVEYAVFEAGLGGTYDATNFKTGHMTVVTKIALDHMHILGDTVEKIAADKCGVVKQGQTVITTHANSGVMDIIKDSVVAKDGKLIVADDTDFDLVLKGQFQKQNAGVAVQAARELGISDDVIKKALLEVSWPGRVEFVEKNVLLDCAHNPEGVVAIRRYVESLDVKKLVIVFGVSKNKDYEKMIKALPDRDKLIFTQASISRRLAIEDIPDWVQCEKIRDPLEALEKAKSFAGEEGLVLVCGSIFIIGDIKSALAPKLVQNLIP